MFACIKNLRHDGLTVAMVVTDYISRRLALLQQRNQLARQYLGMDNIGRTSNGPESVFSQGEIDKLVKKILVEDCEPKQPL